MSYTYLTLKRIALRDDITGDIDTLVNAYLNNSELPEVNRSTGAADGDTEPFFNFELLENNMEDDEKGMILKEGNKSWIVNGKGPSGWEGGNLERRSSSSEDSEYYLTFWNNPVKIQWGNAGTRSGDDGERMVDYNTNYTWENGQNGEWYITKDMNDAKFDVPGNINNYSGLTESLQLRPYIDFRTMVHTSAMGSSEPTYRDVATTNRFGVTESWWPLGFNNQATPGGLTRGNPDKNPPVPRTRIGIGRTRADSAKIDRYYLLPVYNDTQKAAAEVKIYNGEEYDPYRNYGQYFDVNNIETNHYGVGSEIANQKLYKRIDVELDLDIWANQEIEITDFTIQLSSDTDPEQVELELYYKEEDKMWGGEDWGNKKELKIKFPPNTRQIIIGGEYASTNSDGEKYSFTIKTGDETGNMRPFQESMAQYYQGTPHRWVGKFGFKIFDKFNLGEDDPNNPGTLINQGQFKQIKFTFSEISVAKKTYDYKDILENIGITDLISNNIAFSALKTNGSIINWGSTNSFAPQFDFDEKSKIVYDQNNLNGKEFLDISTVKDIIQLKSETTSAYALVNNLGGLISWGDLNDNNIPPSSPLLLSNSRIIDSIEKNDNSTVIWNIKNIYSTKDSFAAIFKHPNPTSEIERAKKVITWGKNLDKFAGSDTEWTGGLNVTAKLHTGNNSVSYSELNSNNNVYMCKNNNHLLQVWGDLTHFNFDDNMHKRFEIPGTSFMLGENSLITLNKNKIWKQNIPGILHPDVNENNLLDYKYTNDLKISEVLKDNHFINISRAKFDSQLINGQPQWKLLVKNIFGTTSPNDTRTIFIKNMANSDQLPNGWTNNSLPDQGVVFIGDINGQYDMKFYKGRSDFDNQIIKFNYTSIEDNAHNLKSDDANYLTLTTGNTDGSKQNIEITIRPPIQNTTNYVGDNFISQEKFEKINVGDLITINGFSDVTINNVEYKESWINGTYNVKKQIFPDTESIVLYPDFSRYLNGITGNELVELLNNDLKDMGLNLDNSIISTKNVYAAQKMVVGPQQYTYNLDVQNFPNISTESLIFTPASTTTQITNTNYIYPRVNKNKKQKIPKGTPFYIGKSKGLQYTYDINDALTGDLESIVTRSDLNAAAAADIETLADFVWLYNWFQLKGNVKNGNILKGLILDPNSNGTRIIDNNKDWYANDDIKSSGDAQNLVPDSFLNYWGSSTYRVMQVFEPGDPFKISTTVATSDTDTSNNLTGDQINTYIDQLPDFKLFQLISPNVDVEENMEIKFKNSYFSTTNSTPGGPFSLSLNGNPVDGEQLYTAIDNVDGLELDYRVRYIGNDNTILPSNVTDEIQNSISVVFSIDEITSTTEEITSFNNHNPILHIRHIDILKIKDVNGNLITGDNLINLFSSISNSIYDPFTKNYSNDPDSLAASPIGTYMEDTVRDYGPDEVAVVILGELRSPHNNGAGLDSGVAPTFGGILEAHVMTSNPYVLNNYTLDASEPYTWWQQFRGAGDDWQKISLTGSSFHEKTYTIDSGDSGYGGRDSYAHIKVVVKYVNNDDSNDIKTYQGETVNPVSFLEWWQASTTTTPRNPPVRELQSNHIMIDFDNFNDKIPNNSKVATINCKNPSGPDSDITFSFGPENFGDNDKFTIDGTSLKIKDSPNYETKSSYTIKILAKKIGAPEVDRTFILSVNKRGGDGGIQKFENIEMNFNANNIAESLTLTYVTAPTFVNNLATSMDYTIKYNYHIKRAKWLVPSENLADQIDLQIKYEFENRMEVISSELISEHDLKKAVTRLNNKYPTDPQQWSKEDVEERLNKINLSQYTTIFLQNNVNGSKLKNITDNELLNSYNIVDVHHRRMILDLVYNNFIMREFCKSKNRVEIGDRFIGQDIKPPSNRKYYSLDDATSVNSFRIAMGLTSEQEMKTAADNIDGAELMHITYTTDVELRTGLNKNSTTYYALDAALIKMTTDNNTSINPFRISLSPDGEPVRGDFLHKFCREYSGTPYCAMNHMRYTQDVVINQPITGKSRTYYAYDHATVNNWFKISNSTNGNALTGDELTEAVGKITAQTSGTMTQIPGTNYVTYTKNVKKAGSTSDGINVWLLLGGEAYYVLNDATVVNSFRIGTVTINFNSSQTPSPLTGDDFFNAVNDIEGATLVDDKIVFQYSQSDSLVADFSISKGHTFTLNDETMYAMEAANAGSPFRISFNPWDEKAIKGDDLISVISNIPNATLANKITYTSDVSVGQPLLGSLPNSDQLVTYFALEAAAIGDSFSIGIQVTDNELTTAAGNVTGANKVSNTQITYNANKNVGDTISGGGKIYYALDRATQNNTFRISTTLYNPTQNYMNADDKGHANPGFSITEVDDSFSLTNFEKKKGYVSSGYLTIEDLMIKAKESGSFIVDVDTNTQDHQIHFDQLETPFNVELTDASGNSVKFPIIKTALKSNALILERLNVLPTTLSNTITDGSSSLPAPALEAQSSAKMHLIPNDNFKKIQLDDKIMQSEATRAVVLEKIKYNSEVTVNQEFSENGKTYFSLDSVSQDDPFRISLQKGGQLLEGQNLIDAGDDITGFQVKHIIYNSNVNANDKLSGYLILDDANAGQPFSIAGTISGAELLTAVDNIPGATWTASTITLTKSMTGYKYIVVNGVNRYLMVDGVVAGQPFSIATVLSGVKLAEAIDNINGADGNSPGSIRISGFDVNSASLNQEIIGKDGTKYYIATFSGGYYFKIYEGIITDSDLLAAVDNINNDGYFGGDTVTAAIIYEKIKYTSDVVVGQELSGNNGEIYIVLDSASVGQPFSIGTMLTGSSLASAKGNIIGAEINHIHIPSISAGYKITSASNRNGQRLTYYAIDNVAHKEPFRISLRKGGQPLTGEKFVIAGNDISGAIINYITYATTRANEDEIKGADATKYYVLLNEKDFVPPNSVENIFRISESKNGDALTGAALATAVQNINNSPSWTEGIIKSTHLYDASVDSPQIEIILNTDRPSFLKPTDANTKILTFDRPGASIDAEGNKILWNTVQNVIKTNGASHIKISAHEDYYQMWGNAVPYFLNSEYEKNTPVYLMGYSFFSVGNDNKSIKVWGEEGTGDDDLQRSAMFEGSHDLLLVDKRYPDKYEVARSDNYNKTEDGYTIPLVNYLKKNWTSSSNWNDHLEFNQLYSGINEPNRYTSPYIVLRLDHLSDVTIYGSEQFPTSNGTTSGQFLVHDDIIGKTQTQVADDGYTGSGNPTQVGGVYKENDLFDGVNLQMATSSVEETESGQKMIVHADIIGKTQGEVSTPPFSYFGSGFATGDGGIYKVGDTFDGITLEQKVTLSNEFDTNHVKGIGKKKGHWLIHGDTEFKDSNPFTPNELYNGTYRISDNKEIKCYGEFKYGVWTDEHFKEMSYIFKTNNNTLREPFQVATPLAAVAAGGSIQTPTPLTNYQIISALGGLDYIRLNYLTYPSDVFAGQLIDTSFKFYSLDNATAGQPIRVSTLIKDHELTSVVANITGASKVSNTQITYNADKNVGDMITGDDGTKYYVLDNATSNNPFRISTQLQGNNELNSFVSNVSNGSASDGSEIKFNNINVVADQKLYKNNGDKIYILNNANAGQSFQISESSGGAPIIGYQLTNLILADLSTPSISYAITSSADRFGYNTPKHIKLNMLGDDFEVGDSFTGDDGTTYYITEILEVTSRFKILKGPYTHTFGENDPDYMLTNRELREVVATIPGMQSPTMGYGVPSNMSGNYWVVYNQNVTRGQVLTATNGNRYTVTSNASLSKSFRISTSQGGSSLETHQLPNVISNFSLPSVVYSTVEYNQNVTIGQEIEGNPKRWVIDDATAGKPFRIGKEGANASWAIDDLSLEYNNIPGSSITHISARETVNTPNLPNVISGATITNGGESYIVLNKNDALLPAYNYDHFVTTNIAELLGSNKSGYCVKREDATIISWTSASEEQTGMYWWNNSSGTSEWEKTKEAYVSHNIFAPPDGLGKASINDGNVTYEREMNSPTLYSTDHSFALEYLSVITLGQMAGTTTRTVYCFGYWKTGAVDVKYDGSDKLNSNETQGKIVSNVQEVFTTDRAFAVIKTDGSLECWGDPEYGGMYQGRQGDPDGASPTNPETWADSSLVDSTADGFSKISKIFSTKRSFAALTENNSVFSWGSNQYGGNKEKLDNIIKLTSTENGFAAITERGELISWGNNNDFNSNMQGSNGDNNNNDQNNNDPNNNDPNNNDPGPPPPDNGSGY